jgi:DNA-binding response OmpR family regulator
MPTILCIEDDPRVLGLQKSLLEMNGYSVLTAPDGATGIALASTHPVDAVVLDFRMPGMEGDQVASLLLKQQPDLPIVIYTGFLDAVPEWVLWCAAAYLQKGDGPDALLAAIQGLFADKKVHGPGGGMRRSVRKPATA